MKVLARKAAAILAIMALALTTMQTSVDVQAASASKVKKAYVDFLKKQVANCKYADDIEYYLYDFNKDGTSELVVAEGGGARPYYDVYTYKNKKIVCLEKDTNEVGYISGKKYLVSYGSGGWNNFSYDVYKIKKNKLVKVNTYACVNGVYKKDGKKIEKSVFDAFVKTVVTDLGTAQTVPAKYLSPKQLGFSVYGSSGQTYTAIKRATKKKIFYYSYKLGSESATTDKSKLKSAKITGKTKFYYGDLNYLFSQSKSSGTMDTKKWVKEISKKQFIEKMKTYSGGSDQITVKNGKVTKVIIHIQVAG